MNNARFHNKASRRLVNLLTSAGLILLGVNLTLALFPSLVSAHPWDVTIDAVNPISGSPPLTVTVSGTWHTTSCGAGSVKRVEVNWGDGTVQTVMGPYDGCPSPHPDYYPWGPASHTYTALGTYTICATLIHQSPSGADAEATYCWDTPVTVGEQLTPTPPSGATPPPGATPTSGEPGTVLPPTGYGPPAEAGTLGVGLRLAASALLALGGLWALRRRKR